MIYDKVEYNERKGRCYCQVVKPAFALSASDIKNRIETEPGQLGDTRCDIGRTERHDLS